MLLAACGSSGGGTPGPKFIVSGKVLDGAGAPVADANVAIAGSIVKSNLDGAFTIPGVSAPYDVAAYLPSSLTASLYVGLTRSDPIVTLTTPASLSPIPTPYTASVRGQLSGGAGFPQPVGHRVRFLFAGPSSASASVTSVAVGSDGTYALAVSWFGTTSLTGTLRVVQDATDVSGATTSFDGSGSIDVALSPAASGSGQDIHLDPVSQGRVTGTVIAAPGYSLLGRSLRTTVAGGDSLLIRSESGVAGSSVPPGFDYPAFAANGTTLTLAANAQDSAGAFTQAWRAGLAPGQTVDLLLPSAPKFEPTSLAQPVSAGSTLSWSAVPGALYDVTATPTGSASGPTLRIVTTRTHLQVPDLSQLGMTWPRSTPYQVSLAAYSPRTADDAAGGAEEPPPDRDGQYAVSAGGSFVTAP